MLTIMTIAGWLIALAAAFPLLIFSLELLAGIWPSARARTPEVSARAAVLIPAHDEAAGIAITLDTLRRSIPLGTRVVVVADNCTDETAAHASAAGAEVVERHDGSRRGKGFALAHGRDYLATNDPPEVVLVLDADCRFEPGSVELLCEAALRSGRAVQAVNFCDADLAARPMIQISNFAMVVKNLYRSRGMQRLGGPGLLTGTGMAFPWAIYKDAPLATGSIVEDLELGVAQTRLGKPPLLVDRAQVRSKAATGEAALQQRRRWEHGFLDTLRRQALPVLIGGLRRGSRRETLLGLHLSVPPLALLMMLAVMALVLNAILMGFGNGPAAFTGLAIILALALTLVLCAWLVGGRPFLTGRAVLAAPFYLLWKLPLYASFLRRPQAAWNRTTRQP